VTEFSTVCQAKDFVVLQREIVFSEGIAVTWRRCHATITPSLLQQHVGYLLHLKPSFSPLMFPVRDNYPNSITFSFRKQLYLWYIDNQVKQKGSRMMEAYEPVFNKEFLWAQTR